MEGKVLTNAHSAASVHDPLDSKEKTGTSLKQRIQGYRVQMRRLKEMIAEAEGCSTSNAETVSVSAHDYYADKLKPKPQVLISSRRTLSNADTSNVEEGQTRRESRTEAQNTHQAQETMKSVMMPQSFEMISNNSSVDNLSSKFGQKRASEQTFMNQRTSSSKKCTTRSKDKDLVSVSDARKSFDSRASRIDNKFLAVNHPSSDQSEMLINDGAALASHRTNI